MRTKFRILLDEMFKTKGIYIGFEKTKYIKGLKTASKKLWKSYRSENIQVDYNDIKIQDVYLIRYFSFYAEILNKELQYLKDEGHDFSFLKETELKVSLFCSGPIPESVSVAKFINGSSVKNVIINSFDLNVNAWKSYRNLVKNKILPLFDQDIEYKSRPFQFDLREKINKGQLEYVKQSKIITFQNCLNEIEEEEHDTFLETVVEILNSMDSGSYLVFIERSGYDVSIELLCKISKVARDKGLAILSNKEEKKISDFDLKKAILLTECNEILCPYMKLMDGTVLSPHVSYYSLIISK